jgi:hypothetical protein
MLKATAVEDRTCGTAAQVGLGGVFIRAAVYGQHSVAGHFGDLLPTFLLSIVVESYDKVDKCNRLVYRCLFHILSYFILFSRGSLTYIINYQC